MFVATGPVQAPMQPSAVTVEKIKHKHSRKESNFPLPSLTSALPLCSRPLEFIQPLATRAEAWQAIPGVSEWVMGIIKRGYSLQFARRPPRFSGVVSTSVHGENARVLRSEVMTLLEKGAIEMVPPALSESGFTAVTFLIPRNDGGLRPILDLRRLNHALMRRPFRMITLKQILSQIRTGDWFCSLDLKDAYFHIQIAPHHRRFLRFAFEGVAYQYTVLPFGLSLPPVLLRSAWKCSFPSETDGNPHSQLPRRLAHSGPVRGGTTFTQNPHPQPLRAPGAQGQFRQNRTVSQPTSIVPGYSSGLSSHESGDSARTRSGHSETHGHLQERHRSPTQSVSENAGPHGHSIASVTAGPASHAPPSTLVETTGSTQRMASWTPAYQGESGLCNSPDPLEEPTVDGEGRGHGVGPHQEICHDRRLQHRLGGAVRRQTDLRPLVEGGEGLPHQLLGNVSSLSSLPVFLPDLIGCHVLIRSDNMSVVSYISHQGGVSSKRLFILAERLLEWAQLNLHSLRAAHLPGRLNQGADMLSLSNVPSEEWMLHPQVVQKIWKIFGKAEVYLFASKDNSHCPIYYSKDRDALAHDWPNLLLYAFPPIALLPQVVRRVREQGHKVLLVAPPPCGGTNLGCQS